MSTTTPVYNFILPAVNDAVDANIWGTELNSNFSNLDTDLKAVSDAANSGVPLVGDLKATARSTPPTLWLVCNGAAVDRTTYASLFSAIGTTYGSGNGTTTFNIPDAGARALVGKEAVATRLTSAVSGIDGATLGASGGDQNVAPHILTSVVTDPGHIHAEPSGGGSGSSIGAFLGRFTSSFPGISTGSATTGITVATTDAATGTAANIQPTLVVNWLIYAGV